MFVMVSCKSLVLISMLHKRQEDEVTFVPSYNSIKVYRDIKIGQNEVNASRSRNPRIWP
jgi:hypothetical protein